MKPSLVEIGRNKKYDGYKAYQYLKLRVEYKAFRLREAIVEGWSYKVQLSKTEEERSEGIIEKSSYPSFLLV